VTGPATTSTLALEKAAASGQVRVSDATAAQIDPSLGGPSGLLRRAPAAPALRATAPDTTGVDLEACLPPAVREHLLAGGGEAEHRSIAVAFVEFGGTDDLLVREGPSALGDALERCVRAAKAEAARYGVTVLEADPGEGTARVILVAGAPRGTGDEERRMMGAVRALLDAELPLPVRAGVNRGRVFADDFGPPYRRTYSVTGDAVNVAARIQSQAAWGRMLASEEVVAQAPRRPARSRPCRTRPCR
jgi:class 3 adenylate cyclase